MKKQFQSADLRVFQTVKLPSNFQAGVNLLSDEVVKGAHAGFGQNNSWFTNKTSVKTVKFWTQSKP
jgi:hypothetical protein